MAKIVWSDQAKEDLQDIYNYISLSSKNYANNTLTQIRLKIDLLETNPLIGKMEPYFQNPIFRKIICGNYKIFYKIIDEHTINISAIIHGKRDVEFHNF